MVLIIYFSGQESDFGIGKIKKSITIYCVEHFFLLYKLGWNPKNRVSTLYIITKKIYYRLVIFNKTPLVLSSLGVSTFEGTLPKKGIEQRPSTVAIACLRPCLWLQLLSLRHGNSNLESKYSVESQEF